ncbi:hypothetical protein Arub01_19840 [Actinomadura rubrobrunea]|uniref:Uncharacterized protein n=1 Tax=Actinomadura rubrobrunea TaxID=115335 RepID=A0A9W6UWJ5_9ACTN|nr:hypothetical protein Arub01_19840 [Actinomadura rubrobrunea]
MRRRSRGDGEAVDRGRGDTTVFRAGVGVGVGRGATYSPIVGSMGTDGAGDDFTAAVCGSGAGGASRRTPATTLIAAITATTTPPPTRRGLRGRRVPASFAFGPPRCRPVTGPKRTATPRSDLVGMDKGARSLPASPTL